MPRQARPFAKFEEGKKQVVALERTQAGGIFGRPVSAVRAVPVYVPCASDIVVMGQLHGRQMPNLLDSSFDLYLSLSVDRMDDILSVSIIIAVVD